MDKTSAIAKKAMQKVRGLLPKKKKPFALFQLPPEIREIIYEYALVCDEAININPTRVLSASHVARTDVSRSIQRAYARQLTVALLRTNRQVHQEASAVLYRRNNFQFLFGGSWMVLELWFIQIGGRNVFCLRSINVCRPFMDGARTGEAPPLEGSPFSLFPNHPIQAVGPLGRMSRIQDADFVAFQRVCAVLAQLSRLQIITIPRQEFGTSGNYIAYRRYFVVRARAAAVVRSSDFTIMTREARQGINGWRDGVEVRNGFALQVELHWWRLNEEQDEARAGKMVYDYIDPARPWLMIQNDS